MEVAPSAGPEPPRVEGGHHLEQGLVDGAPGGVQLGHGLGEVVNGGGSEECGIHGKT